MKIKNSVLAFIILFITCIATVNAEAITNEDEVVNEVVAETTKYYKTVTILNNSEVMTAAGMGELSSFTTEITQEEYENADDDGISPQSSVITEYKKLTSTISKYSTKHYKYSASLTWRKMPATRSYDVIGIGYYGSVKLSGGIEYKQSYCNVDGNCYSENAGYYNYRGSNGYGAMFHLPSGSLTSLSQSISILVEKTNSSSTIIEQVCAADYSHAQKTISYSLAKDFTVDTGGIKLLGDNYSYYDSINTASTTWEGTW